MKLVFTDLEQPVVLHWGMVKTIEVENSHLFARLCESILSGKGKDAVERYSIWDDDGNELTSSGSLFVISDPLRLPWDSKDLSGKLLDVMESLLFEDEEIRRGLEGCNSWIFASILRGSHQLGGDYHFTVEWDLRQYLKSFGFTIDRGESQSYLDSLITFLDFACDMGLKKMLVFFNLKTFLEKNEYELFLKRTVFLGLNVLLLENKRDYLKYDLEDKTIIDQHFLEY